MNYSMSFIRTSILQALAGCAGLLAIASCSNSNDLAGGGIIVGLDGIREAYETGRGTFRTRAKVSVAVSSTTTPLAGE